MKRATSYILPVALVALGVLFPLFFGPYPQTVARTIFKYMALALTWDMLFRSGQVSFGIAGFFGLGTYAAALLALKAGFSYPLAILAGALISGIFAYILGFLVLRLRGTYFSITTLALAEIFRVILRNWTSFSGGPEGIVLPQIIFNGDSRCLYWIGLAVLLVVVVVSQYFEKSKLHFSLISIRDNEVSAQTSGVNIFRTLLVVFTVTSFLQGLIGAVDVVSVGYAMPDSAFDSNYTLLPLAMALLGGQHSTWGPIIGSVLLGVASEYLKLKIPYGHLLVYGVIIILVILFMPEGLIGLFRKKKGAKRG
ncbi:MAG: branched-chain amino acid ABC transporter permease [Spirochaetaceae bacterium]|nr:branched-chain amino acid ABC transporter permease [Spirochaetaceae bacterium]